MHDHYGMTAKFLNMDDYTASKNLEFRTKFIQEELDELSASESAEDVVDALIDIVVVAIGTLHAYGVDSHLAWDEVLRANMSKEPGIKPERPNPLGLPDLTKPEGWVAPNHSGNDGPGLLERVMAFRGTFSPCEV